MGSWEQTVHERSEWRGLINKGVVLNEKKRICEAETKRRQREANTNGPPADTMTLICSTSNRQIRARIGLVSHQRTHQQTRTISRNNDVLSHSSERRTTKFALHLLSQVFMSNMLVMNSCSLSQIIRFIYVIFKASPALYSEDDIFHIYTTLAPSLSLVNKV